MGEGNTLKEDMQESVIATHSLCDHTVAYEFYNSLHQLQFADEEIPT